LGTRFADTGKPGFHPNPESVKTDWSRVHERDSDPREAAEYLSVHVRTIYRLVKQGEDSQPQSRGSWRFKKGVLDEWLSGQEKTFFRGKRMMQGKQILVVDQEKKSRDLLLDVLTRFGNLGGGTGRQWEEALQKIVAETFRPGSDRHGKCPRWTLQLVDEITPEKTRNRHPSFMGETRHHRFSAGSDEAGGQRFLLRSTSPRWWYV